MISKILMVDDSAARQQMYKIMLSRYKCEVISALGGQEGLKKLTDNPDVNLMIVDENMLHMKGLEFIKRVKEQEAYRHIPIIVVGAKGCDADSDDAIACSQGYLTRPFTSNELHALVEKLLPQSIVAN